jgi:hypothetical protein
MVYTVKTCYLDKAEVNGVRIDADIELWVES